MQTCQLIHMPALCLLYREHILQHMLVPSEVVDQGHLSINAHFRLHHKYKLQEAQLLQKTVSLYI